MRQLAGVALKQELLDVAEAVFELLLRFQNEHEVWIANALERDATGAGGRFVNSIVQP